MNIVDQWLPENIYCYSQVFRIDEYAEIMNLFAKLAFNLESVLPQEFSESSLSRRASYIAGRGCALTALKNAGDVTDSKLCRTEKGLPNWPQGFVGSISHANKDNAGFAIAVVAKGAEYPSIAIDCEPIFSTNHANEIAPLTASLNEQRLGERLGLNRELWLTMIYSLKETLFKLLYAHVNCFMPFEAAEVLSFDVNTGQTCVMLTVDWGDLATGQRFWLKTKAFDIEQIGECVVSFGSL